MISPKDFLEELEKNNMSFFAGVPDSLLKDFCAYLDDHISKNKHIITANEGNAVAIAAGYYMATGKPPVVYMQNSGLGNAVNPLTSLTHKEVYSLPMLLIIGWRGESSTTDEPQHIKQGKVTCEQLDLLDIPYKILDKLSCPHTLIEWAYRKMQKSSSPVAFVIKKNTFSIYNNKPKPKLPTFLLREEALTLLLPLIGDACIVSTTGKTSRELFELREFFSEQQRDFLTVGSMGHALSIALGVALGKPNKKIICIDGDGSLLMHLGALPITGSLSPTNLVHVLLNNAAHESVGGQPTVADKIDFQAIALACGYTAYAMASTAPELEASWKKLSLQPGPVMLEVRIKTGSRKNLGRPKTTPIENKREFMHWVEK